MNMKVVSVSQQHDERYQRRSVEEIRQQQQKKKKKMRRRRLSSSSSILFVSMNAQLVFSLLLLLFVLLLNDNNHYYYDYNPIVYAEAAAVVDDNNNNNNNKIRGKASKKKQPFLEEPKQQKQASAMSMTMTLEFGNNNGSKKKKNKKSQQQQKIKNNNNNNNKKKTTQMSTKNDNNNNQKKDNKEIIKSSKKTKHLAKLIEPATGGAKKAIDHDHDNDDEKAKKNKNNNNNNKSNKANVVTPPKKQQQEVTIAKAAVAKMIADDKSKKKNINNNNNNNNNNKKSQSKKALSIKGGMNNNNKKVSQKKHIEIEKGKKIVDDNHPKKGNKKENQMNNNNNNAKNQKHNIQHHNNKNQKGKHQQQHQQKQNHQEDNKKKKKKKKQIPEADAIVPLHINSGTLHAYVYIGSPPQRQILILDTGSKYMSFPCLPLCDGKKTCGKHISNFYSLNISTTDQLNLNGPHECFLTNAQQQAEEQRKAKSPQGRGMPMFAFMRKKSTDTMPPTINPITKFGNTSKYCVIGQEYLEGSAWEAFEVEDLIWLGTEDFDESIDLFLSLIGVPYTFGCQFSTKGLFKSQYADGILGLAHYETNYIKYLSQQPIHHDGTTILNRYAFSFCVSPGVKHGTLSLGGSLPATRYHNERMKFTNITRELHEIGASNKHGLYNIKVTALYVGNICITCPYDGTNNTLNRTTVIIENDDDDIEHMTLVDSFNLGRGTIFDTGTTDTYVPKQVSEAFIEAWVICTGEDTKKNTFHQDSIKRKLPYTFEEFEKLCSITFEMENNDINDPNNPVRLTIEPSSFMEGVPMKVEKVHGTLRATPNKWNGKLTLTNRMYLDEDKGAVLGVSAMVGYDILYDNEDNQIGVAKAKCPSY